MTTALSSASSPMRRSLRSEAKARGGGFRTDIQALRVITIAIALVVVNHLCLLRSGAGSSASRCSSR